MPERSCKDYRPFVLNKDICESWMRPYPDFLGDREPTTQFLPHCRKGLDCLTAGQRPERADQESDSEE